MRIKILSIAEDDLEEGHRFYKSQADGLGTYFLDTLYSDKKWIVRKKTENRSLLLFVFVFVC